MTENDPQDQHARDEADAAAAEAGSIGGRRDPDEDPAEQPVEEAGGGESEGFELAEQDLIENASHGDQHTTTQIMRDADGIDEEQTDAEYGEADDEQPPD